tara:strand:- start:73 stop:456 length:384 start_codon:yes stop_codon:yes gene_type:complete
LPLYNYKKQKQMITYDWNCKTVDAYVEQGGNDDVVYNAHWRVTGTKEEGEKQYSSTNIGTQTLDISDITNFIPFDELTNDEVVAWTQATMGAEQVAAIETNIANAINLEINPVSITLTIGEPVPPVE